jgi:hypothetical protein
MITQHGGLGQQGQETNNRDQILQHLVAASDITMMVSPSFIVCQQGMARQSGERLRQSGQRVRQSGERLRESGERLC